VPGIERVVSDHIHSFLREVSRVLFEDGGEVFVVGEGHLEIIKSTVFAVNSHFGAVYGVLRVGVFALESVIGKDAVFVVFASYGEDVAYD